MALHKKSTSRYSKLIVLLCILVTFGFTQECMYFYWCEKTVDPVLIGFLFGCYGLEFGSLAFIKRGEYRYVEGAKGGYVERIEEEDGN